MPKHHPTSENGGNTTNKIFVRKGGEATIVCPSCDRSRTVPVSKFKGKKHDIKVRCSCSFHFTINLDYRRAYRKQTNLSAHYITDEKFHDEGWAMVKNLSLSGLCFETANFHNMRPGQQGFIEFDLDNKKKSRLNKKFRIRSVNGNTLRCEFINLQAYEKDLGFYLIPGLWTSATVLLKIQWGSAETLQSVHKSLILTIHPIVLLSLLPLNCCIFILFFPSAEDWRDYKQILFPEGIAFHRCHPRL